MVSNHKPKLHLRTHLTLFYSSSLEFPPDHLVDDADVRLDYLDDLGGYVLIYIVRDRDSVLAVTAEFHCCIYCLKE